MDETLRARLIGYSKNEQLDQLEDLLSNEEQQKFAPLMQTQHEHWQVLADSLEDEDIRHLIRFFSVAENIPGWEAGAKSPVIPLAKCLRVRGNRLDKPFLLWLRQVSENRYLPYGPL